jgi:myosin-5
MQLVPLRNGEYIKTGLAELENWLIEAKDYTGNAWEELRYIRQAVQLLVIHQKPKKTLNGGACTS